jgi:erythromycin esterase
MRRTLLAAGLLFLMVPPAGAAPAPRPFLDLDFEAVECSSGWWPFTQGRFEAVVDGSVFRSGGQSARIRYTDETVRWVRSRGFGTMSQSLPLREAAGRRVRLTGYIQTEEVISGEASIWISAEDSAGRIATTDSAQTLGARGTAPWTRYEVEMDIPADLVDASIGISLGGAGTAWFDGLAIEIDGRPFQDGKPTAPPRLAKGAVDWLRRQAIPFDTPEAGHGFADLQPLRKVIGDARIVSLGEGTHGTREFFQMKHRLFEFLVEEMGFTHFAIEASMPETERMNEYVLTGTGDPKQILKGMYFWTWNTQEVLELAQWMRAYNASGKGPVRFQGFDMQYALVASFEVRNFLRRVDPKYLTAVGTAFAQIEAAAQAGRGTASDAAAARTIWEHMVAKRDEYAAQAGSERVDWVIQNARVAQQCLEDFAGIRSRDESMAENVGWILDHAPAGSKIVLWAHNRHVSRSPGWMGRYLTERYGKEMVVLGFAFNSGRYNAVGPEGLRDYEALPPIPGSVESYFAAAGKPRFVLDLRKVPQAGAAATWLRKPQSFRSLGAVALRCAFIQEAVASDYDGLIWIDSTSPSVLLPFG